MKARFNNHAELNALRRRLRQQANGAKRLPAQNQPKKRSNQSTQPKKTTINEKPERKFEGVLRASDRSLFQEAMRAVQPLKKQPRHTPEPSTALPTAHDAQLFKQRRLRAESHHHELLSTELSDYYDGYASVEHIEEYLNPICGTDVLRNLRRGQWPLEASIDLHGATLERARERLQVFLQHCFAEEYRCIRIVHGKGYGSANKEPVLLYQIRRWLTQLRPVLAFCDCAPNEGGQGAVKVLLRKPHR